MKKLAWLLLLLAVGCGNKPGMAPVASEAVIVDGKSGDRTISIAILPPARTVQSLVHHWVANDIYEYRVALTSDNGTLIATVPRKGIPKSQAIFTHLKQGLRYQVGLTAWGNQGGTAPSTALNSVVPTAVFDFTAGQDVENSATASLGISFDAVDFDGTGQVQIQDPADGTFRNPTTPEVGTAQ